MSFSGAPTSCIQLPLMPSPQTIRSAQFFLFIKLENILKLNGPINYQVRGVSGKHILSIFNTSVIIKGTDTARYILSKKCFMIRRPSGVYHIYFIQSTSCWMSILTLNRKLFRIYISLQDKFARENKTTFHQQFANLFNITIEFKTNIV